MDSLRQKRQASFLVMVMAILATVAIACGSDNPPASDPTNTPEPGTETPTPTPATGTETPVTPVTVTPSPTPSHSEMQKALDAARQRWLANRPPSYTFDLAWICFCPESGNPTRIKVSGSQIISTTDPDTGLPSGDANFQSPMTIDQLFDWIQTGLDTDSGNVLSVEFERDLGYPIRASVDWVVGAVDDESAFQVTNFRIGTGQTDIDQLKERLSEATNRWFTVGLENYEFVLSRQCFCPPEITAPIRIEVRGGQVFSVTNAETGEPVTDRNVVVMTVPELFSLISERLNRGPEFAELEFDSTYGHPTKASFNPIINLFDDEEAFFIEDLKPVDVHVGLQEQLDEARAKWSATRFANSGNYIYRFNWQCFCIQDFVAEVIVHVEDWEVTRIIREEDGEPVDEQFEDDFVTVETLFDRLQDAIDENATSINATFDADTGLPTQVFIDYQAMIADEEMGWRASEPEASDGRGGSIRG